MLRKPDLLVRSLPALTATHPNARTCTRGAVLEVNLDPTVGSEANKTRPCVVVQNDIGNAIPP